MKSKEALARVKELIQESQGIADELKYEMRKAVEKADVAVESFDLGKRIEVFQRLMEDMKNPELFTDQGYLAPRYLEVLDKSLKDLISQKRRVDYTGDEYFPAFDDYRPITVGALFKTLGDVSLEPDGTIVLHPREPGLLDKTIDVYEDDGMGYSPNGAQPVFSGYMNKDRGTLDLWT